MTPPTLRRILYVEDDPDIQSIVRHAIEADGKLTLDTCDSAAEALARAPRLKPDLAMLDIVLPDMDGGDLYRRLRALPGLQNLPAILVTSLAETQNVQFYEKLGTVGLILKPFDTSTLTGRIDRLWTAYWKESQGFGDLEILI